MLALPRPHDSVVACACLRLVAACCWSRWPRRWDGRAAAPPIIGQHVSRLDRAGRVPDPGDVRDSGRHYAAPGSVAPVTAQLGSTVPDWRRLVGWRRVVVHQSARSRSPTTASLLQNTQPLFVVFLAVLFLKERLERLYWPCLAVSIAGAYLLSFGTSGEAVTLSGAEATAAGLALAAAALWSCGTVLARVVLSEMSCVVLTAARILFALPFVALVGLPQGSLHGSVSGLLAHPVQLGASALAPGLLAMLLFYRGLRGSKASHAVLAEFMYPVAALVGNWIVLGTLITPLQGVGCLLLVGTVFVLSWNPTAHVAPRPAHAEVGVEETGFAFG